MKQNLIKSSCTTYRREERRKVKYRRAWSFFCRLCKTIMELVDLSPMDRMVAPVYSRMLFIYDHTLSFEDLNESLVRVMLRDYRPWTGRVRRLDENRSALCYDPSASLHALLPMTSLDCSIGDIKGKKGGYDIILEDLVYPKELVAPEEGGPALFLHLFTFSRSEGGVLAVSLHHQVGDGSAQFAFVNAWCDECKRRGIAAISPKRIIYDRKTLSRPPLALADIPSAYHFISKPSDGKGQSRGGAPSILLRFPMKELRQLKETISKTISAPNYISMNDLLIALLFRCHTRAHLLDPSTPVFMKFNVDARGRSTAYPREFSGNATIFSQVGPMPAVSVLDSTLVDIALMVRKGILSVDDNLVADVISLAEKYSAAEAQAAFAMSPCYLHISNWDSFGGLDDYDFGKGGAVAIRLPPPGIDALCYVLPSKGAIECALAIGKDAIPRVMADAELASIGAEVVAEFSSLRLIPDHLS